MTTKTLLSSGACTLPMLDAGIEALYTAPIEHWQEMSDDAAALALVMLIWRAMVEAAPDSMCCGETMQ